MINEMLQPYRHIPQRIAILKHLHLCKIWGSVCTAFLQDFIFFIEKTELSISWL